MPKQPNKEFKVEEWQERIRNGMRFQSMFANSNCWHKYKEYYRHQFAEGVIPVNLVFSVLRSLVPQLYLRNPRVTVTPRKPGLLAQLNARIVQKVDNWLIQEMMIKEQMKLMAQDSFLAGTASGFFGYDSLYGMDTSKFENTQLSLTQFSKRGFRTEYNANVNPGMPWFLRARPEDVIYPWGCDSARNAEWVAMRVFRPLEDVKADPKYENTKDLTGSMTIKRSGPEGSEIEDPEYSHAFEGFAKERDWVEIFQIHDARTGKIYATTLNPNNDKFLRNQEDELQLDGLPVETLTFNTDPDFIYGIPDARIIEPQQLEINDIRTQAMKHRRVDVLKAIVKKGVFTEEEIEKLMSESVKPFVTADTDGPLADAIISFTGNVSGVLQDLAASGELVRADVREMVGFNRNAQGEFQGKTHVSATETKNVAQAMNIRLDERRDMMADLLARVIRRTNQVIFKYWDQEQVTEITGPDGAQWWLKYTGQQIRDEYDVEISPEEGINLSAEVKFDMALRVAEAWAKMNAPAIAQGAPVPAEIQRLVFAPFEQLGLDVDKLDAQMNGAQQQQQNPMMGGLGQSPQQPVDPAFLAAAQGAS